MQSKTQSATPVGAMASASKNLAPEMHVAVNALLRYLNEHTLPSIQAEFAKTVQRSGATTAESRLSAMEGSLEPEFERLLLPISADRRRLLAKKVLALPQLRPSERLKRSVLSLSPRHDSATATELVRSLSAVVSLPVAATPFPIPPQSAREVAAEIETVVCIDETDGAFGTESGFNGAAA
ncbi:MAG: hypothetical protein RL685_3630 [Pseudomonadota bacterium]|jgi:hypothetical protein